MGAMAILLVILAVVLIRSNRQKRTNNQMLERKVKERTKELELNRDMLQRSLDERDFVLEKISSEIRSTFATIRGLCSLVLTDMETEDRGQYIRSIDKTSEQLLMILRRTISHTTASK
jgi:Skp family chaperone for outer membrane proteins